MVNIVIKNYVDENAELMVVVSLLKRMHLVQLLRECFMLTVRQLLSLQFSSEKSYYPLWRSKNVFSQIFCASCSSLIVFFLFLSYLYFWPFLYLYRIVQRPNREGSGIDIELGSLEAQLYYMALMKWSKCPLNYSFCNVNFFKQMGFDFKIMKFKII